MNKTMKLLLVGAMMLVSACITIIPDDNGTGTTTQSSTNTVETTTLYTNTLVQIGSETNVQKTLEQYIDERIAYNLNDSDFVVDEIEVKNLVVDGKSVSLSGHTHKANDIIDIEQKLKDYVKFSDFETVEVGKMNAAGITIDGKKPSLEGHKHQLKDIEGIGLIGTNALNNIDNAKNLEQLKSAMKDFIKDITNLKGE